MVWNLLSNALKFTPEGGRVSVGLRTAAGQVLIEVQDTGCGLPREVEELVFDRCLQPELLDPPPHGLGLGLPLCMYIAQGHGGRLLLHAESGRGTTAVAALPDREDGSADRRGAAVSVRGRISEGAGGAVGRAAVPGI